MPISGRAGTGPALDLIEAYPPGYAAACPTHSSEPHQEPDNLADEMNAVAHAQPNNGNKIEAARYRHAEAWPLVRLTARVNLRHISIAKRFANGSMTT